MTTTIHFTMPFRQKAAVVHDALCDMDRALHWMPGIQRIEILTPGPFGVGTRWRETRKMFGKEAAETFTVTGVEPGKSVSTYCNGREGTSGMGDMNFRMECIDTPSGCKVSFTGTFDNMGGVVKRLFFKMFKGMFVSAMRKDLSALAAYLDKTQGTKGA